MRNPNSRLGVARAPRVSTARLCAPSARQAAALKDALQSESDAPLDVLVRDPSSRRTNAWTRGRSCAFELPAGSLLAIPSPLPDVELFVTCPELTFIQVTRDLDILQVIYSGTALCSEYRIDPSALAGVVLRQGNDKPLTSVARIEAYLGKAASLCGTVPATRASHFVLDKARSPKEIGLAMLFGLPPHLGGFGLGTVALNEQLDIPDGCDAYGNPRIATRYPDLLITTHDRRGSKRAVAIDYDSFSAHANTTSMAKDARRRNEIESVDWLRHYTLTTNEVRDFLYMERFADRLRRALGQRRTPQADDAHETQEEHLRREAVAAKRFELWRRFVSGSGEL